MNNNQYFIELYSNFVKNNKEEIGKNLYMFDKQLKLLLLNSLFDIEQNLKGVFINNFIRRYSDEKEKLFDKNCYSNNIITSEIISRTNKQLSDYSIPLKELKYYEEKYNYIPIGAYVRMLSFGLLRDLYYISKPNDKDHMCKKLTKEPISSHELETILEFLVNIRNICCHDEILFSYIHEKTMIPNTKYHKYFNFNNIQYGKKDFLAILISIKLLIDRETFSNLIDNINKIINKAVKKLDISKSELLQLMHLPKNYTNLKKL